MKRSLQSRTHLVSAQEGLKRSTQPLYIAEGQRSSPTPCAELATPEADKVLARYFAYTRGSKAIVKEHCESDSLIALPPLEPGQCSGVGCRYYDTYRRGPTYFARILAALEAMTPSADVEVNALKANTGSGGTPARKLGDEAGLFSLNQHREVQRQRLRFALDQETRCIAQLKVFREERQRDRVDQTDEQKLIKMPARLGMGDIWAEHRESAQGYELLILERQIARDRSEGELLEVELLCINPHEQINPHRALWFGAQEVNRDTLRIFARPKR